MTKYFENKVVLVTGGAQGIGAGIVEAVFRRGADVAIVDKQSEKAGELSARLANTHQHIISITADLSIQQGCKTAIEQTVGSLGTLDFLVNNAAPGRDKAHIGQLSNADWNDHAIMKSCPVDSNCGDYASIVQSDSNLRPTNPMLERGILHK